VTELVQRRSLRCCSGLKGNTADHRPPHVDVLEGDRIDKQRIIVEDGEIRELSNLDTANEVIEFELECCTDGGGVQGVFNGNAFIGTEYTWCGGDPLGLQAHQNEWKLTRLRARPWRTRPSWPPAPDRYCDLDADHPNSKYGY
jgi:hypothetical protein